MDGSEEGSVAVSSASFEIRIKDFRTATEPLFEVVNYKITKILSFSCIANIIPNHVEDNEEWLGFEPTFAHYVEIKNNRILDYLFCTMILYIIDVEGNSRFPNYIRKLPNTPSTVLKYLKKSFILKREEEFLHDGVLTLRVNFNFDSRYFEGMNESDNEIEKYWSKDNFFRFIDNEDTTETPKDTFRLDSDYTMKVYDYTLTILKLPQFHEARRRFGVYGIPPKISLLSSELVEVNPDIFEHVWMFDIEDEYASFFHRFLVSLDEREDSVGTKLLKASPVLRRMVNAPLREQREKRIEFANTSARIIYYVFEFLDHGKLKIEDLDGIVRVYKFSHLYEMEELQRKCAELMEKIPRHESELEELEKIAELYQDEYLSLLLQSRREECGNIGQPLFRTDDVPNSDCYI